MLENAVAVSAVNPPDRISGVLANAPFDVMQVSRVDASLRHVAFEGGRSGGAVTATGKIRVTTFFTLQRAVKADGVRAAFELPGKCS